jgi:hypothetical protein
MKSKPDEGISAGWPAAVMAHGWLGIAIWMSVGLLLESLMAYKAPSYLDDAQRRELFRLAHAHGTLLHAVLVLAALCGRSASVPVSRLGRFGLRGGAIVMPVGFFLAGLWHPEGDPGLFIWLVPAGAAMTIFGVVAITIAYSQARKEQKRL